ncbi:DUF3391 domain-containing protein [Ramlibacter sp. H39-3-26]|uniref:HD-GYP domain-containing protein n=1 Tax=Curvibacter soli TaxID=3031331 RepID=UPI0023DC8364|nr:HD domain-containing phosphohydrolase [Ramlibacter sp. H39-3-26]MDF1485335.1 DUF3391 domain-containing protein [Ramlibacter sp. H39-3-26]
MEESPSRVIDIQQLRKGMFVQLDLGWMEHPFALNSFKIVTDEQLQTLRGLGLRQIRYFPDKSDAAATVPGDEASPPDGGPRGASSAAQPGLDPLLRPQLASLLEAQERSLLQCERSFLEATRQFRRVAELVRPQPEDARAVSERLVSRCIGEMLSNGESVIRLLSEGAGERNAMHSVNVMVICLLLGKTLGMEGDDLTQLGMAALLHDLGKMELPDRVRFYDEYLCAAELKVYQEHVGHSLAFGRQMGLAPVALDAIGQHHEMVDGSGFPRQLKMDALSPAGKILGLVNRYDNLCNPARAAMALTPHEALSVIFAQMKLRFDSVALGAFIRMMGIYPPGSVVQLVNDCFALVVSVNSSRPLRPKVIVYEPRVPKEEALVLDLENTPELGIRRSLKPVQLPKAALDYLSPRQRICYFFERAVDPQPPEDTS